MPIDLAKRTEVAFISLQKAADKAPSDPGEVGAQIKLAIDYSSSMNDGYPNRFYDLGDMQELAESVLGLSVTGLDDDGNVQVYPFHSLALDSFTVDASNYPGAIQRWRTTPDRYGNLPSWGGTNYLPVIDKIVAEADLSPTKPPTLAIFQTDGLTSNAKAVQRRLKELSDKPIFWVFIGLGNNTDFLGILDNMPGRVIDNVASVGFSRVVGLDPANLYDAILEEFITKWLPAVRAKRILTWNG